MCGIWARLEEKRIDLAMNAAEKLRTRGPEYQGIHTSPGITMVHTRLAIIDLDKRSNQPFETERCVISFNGEIYNYKELKSEYLKTWRFKTESDTEVITALYEVYGVKHFNKLNGMFAFILHDKLEGKTFFMRDMVGIKPLYFIYHNGIIECSSLMSALSFKGEIDNTKLNDILALGYPRRPIYNQVYEFKPGVLYDESLRQHEYIYKFSKRTFKEAIEQQYLTSDVPVAITLSGGVDSGYIAWICSKISKDKLHTFTIGFDKDDEDVVMSRELAGMIGSQHHEIILDKSEIDKYYDEAIKVLEIPMDMGSTVQTYILAKEIKKFGIKCILIGEGSDELNGGYKRHTECIGKMPNDAWDFYKKRIIKLDYNEREKILGKDTIPVSPSMEVTTMNTILDWDFDNELRYYHLKRIDHIVSSFGIEARVPYLDLACVQTVRDMKFHDKIGKKNLRNEALENGLHEKFAMRPKKPLKLFDDMKPIMIKNITKVVNNGKTE
jgi:asparagine synthase (glutamine-hydrolysing)